MNNTIRCPNCGAEATPESPSARVVCEYCRTVLRVGRNTQPVQRISSCVQQLNTAENYRQRMEYEKKYKSWFRSTLWYGASVAALTFLACVCLELEYSEAGAIIIILLLAANFVAALIQGIIKPVRNNMNSAASRVGTVFLLMLVYGAVLWTMVFVSAFIIVILRK